jgi:hypothetical protein
MTCIGSMPALKPSIEIAFANKAHCADLKVS